MKPIDLSQLKVYPLAERNSMASIEETLIANTSCVARMTSAPRGKKARA